jgi:hypothetical protein
MTTEASRPQPSPASPRTDQPAARKRSPIERVIVWGLILALVAVMGLEARARIGYDKTRDALEARNLERLSTLEDAIHFWPARQKKTIWNQPLIELKWFSLVHDYRIALLIDSIDSDDPRVTTFRTAGEENGILSREGVPEPQDPPPGSEAPDPSAYGSRPSGPAPADDSAPAGDAAPAGDSDAGSEAGQEANPGSPSPTVDAADPGSETGADSPTGDAPPEGAATDSDESR